MRKIMVIIVLILNGIIIFYACKKEIGNTPSQLEYDTQPSQDNALAEGTFNDVNNITNQALEDGSLSTYKFRSPANSYFSSCATITDSIDSQDTLKRKMIVNFGSVNCLCKDYRYRRGSIIIVYNGHYKDSASGFTVTFDNYFVGKDATKMFKVTGSKTVLNNGHNQAGNLNFSISVNAHLIDVHNQTMDWSSSRNREWIEGDSTTWLDDVYIVTGSASGKSFEGTTFTANITQGLHIPLNCEYITEGKFDLTPTGKPTRSLDFGSGACDENATVTVNGTTFPIILR